MTDVPFKYWLRHFCVLLPACCYNCNDTICHIFREVLELALHISLHSAWCPNRSICIYIESSHFTAPHCIPEYQPPGSRRQRSRIICSIFHPESMHHLTGLIGITQRDWHPNTVELNSDRKELVTQACKSIWAPGSERFPHWRLSLPDHGLSLPVQQSVFLVISLQALPSVNTPI